MYTRLARMAVDAGNVLTQPQLVGIYLSKLEKKLRDAVDTHLLFRYQGEETLAQAYEATEFLEIAFGRREAVSIVSTMMEATKAKKLPTATSSLAEAQPEKVVHCWACGEAGHTKGDPNCSKKKKEGSVPAKAKVEVAKSGEKAGGKGKKPPTCSHCGKTGHTDENCFVLHPEKRPSSSSREKTLEAEIAELKKKLSTSASLGQDAGVMVVARTDGNST